MSRPTCFPGLNPLVPPPSPRPPPHSPQRFRRISEFESESEDEADDWAPASDSEEEVGGCCFVPAVLAVLVCAVQGNMVGGE